MKLVQDYLKETDTDLLINQYLYAHPLKLDDLSDEEKSVKEKKKTIREKLRCYVERLRTLEIRTAENGKEYILFAHRVIGDGYGDIEYSLVCKQEVLEKGVDAQTYSYMFDRQDLIMGFMVSDTRFTQKNVLGLLGDVMHEASFFGFEQQHLEEELQKLETSAKEIEEGKAVTYSAEEVWAELGIEKEEKDEKADVLQQAVWQATYEYDQYKKKKEVQALLERLQP